ncbi:MAG TPA: hypothetical protein VGC92_13715 [Phenylobacterium sp.]|jgi:hypothetical protein
MSQPPDDHLKALWQGQETETGAMSVEAIRARAGAYRNRLRRGYLTACILWASETVFFAVAGWTARNDTIRLGDLLMIPALSWMIWRMRDRWPSALPDPGASAAVLIDFHRRELNRQRFGLWRFMITLGPALLAAGVMGVGIRTQEDHLSLAHWGPILTLIAIWIAVMAWMVRRQQRKLQRQIEELDATRPG